MKGIEELPNKGEIQKFKKEEVSTEEISLPPGFEWGLLDVNEELTCADVCKFIEDHYVENKHFRLFYSVEKFKWAVMTPGWS